MKNKITGQETILGKNTVQKAKEINDQRKADWKYREGKEKEIATKLGFYPVPEDIS
ncbi:MAG: hypothetical protein LBU27_01430 [Candidatus Peribacteria bacterium]|jgi:hypothetical protein|nr:hypothetical protein [Candidatus Peribacteria bacterium]